MGRTAYLEHAGAVLLDGEPLHFGDVAAEERALRSGCGVLDITADGRLDVAGADAPVFLNRLLTAQVRHLAPGAGTPAFLLTPQGRIVLVLTVLRVGETRYRLTAPAGLAESLHAALDRYLFTERVELAPATPFLAALHLAGPEAADVLARAGLPVPEAPFAHVEGHIAGLPVRVIRTDRLGPAGYDVELPAADFQAAWGAVVGAGGHPAGRVAAERVRVLFARPAWGAELTPETSPLEVSGLFGVTEGKGCYPGQEVVERTLALGSPPRALIALRGEAELVAGAPVQVPGLAAKATEPEALEPIGHVTSAATLSDGRHLALALVRRRFATADEPLRCGGVPAVRTESPLGPA